MRFWALDLEMNQPSGTIIQVGVAWTEATSSDVFYDSVLVNPDEHITDFIENLTGVTNEAITLNGKTRQECWQDVAQLLAGAGVSESGTFKEPIVWGVGDLHTLKSQMNPMAYDVSLPHRFFDAKSTCQFELLAAGKAPGKLSLGTALKRYEVEDVIFPAHDAGVDAANTLKLFLKLMSRRREAQYAIENALGYMKVRI